MPRKTEIGLLELFSLFLELIQVTVGKRDSLSRNLTEGEWNELQDLALEHGLSAFLMDGIDRLDKEHWPPKMVSFQWYGSTLQEELRYSEQLDAERELAQTLSQEGIRTYVLKGAVVSECWPRPDHRRSVDMDCFLLPDWEAGNKAAEQAGYKVRRNYYKNSTWKRHDLTVENHRWLTPFRGNERLKELERVLQRLLHEEKGVSRFEGTELWRPPVMVSAIFMIEHAYSHFLHEGLTWRHILDWWFFEQRHTEEIDWQVLEGWIDEYGFRRFYKSYVRLGQFAVGSLAESDLSEADRSMLEDVWAQLDLHESVDGLRGKLALAGNTWRARWKYREFTDMTWLRALWIQTKGVLFERNPKFE